MEVKTMYLTDYHIHSLHSTDGKSSIEDICEQAIKIGLKEIAITDHYDPYEDDIYCISSYNQSEIISDLLNKVQKYEGRLIIRLGVESGQSQLYPSSTRQLLKCSDYDFVLGSLHNITDDIDLALIDYNKVDINALLSQYLLELLALAKTGLYDCLGHFDYPKRYLLLRGYEYNIKMHDELVSEILNTVIKQGKGIELNTSGFRHGIKEPLPSINVLKMYKEKGGELITIGSDAHICGDVGAYIKDGQRLLKELGFKYITTYEKRQPRQINLA